MTIMKRLTSPAVIFVAAVGFLLAAIPTNVGADTEKAKEHYKKYKE